MTIPTEQIPTYGERAVGLSFNPGGDAAVHHCKKMFAAVIDQMAELRSQLLTAPGTSGAVRLATVAITEAQTALMWAVKALTWRS